jgi:thioredoxin 1
MASASAIDYSPSASDDADRTLTVACLCAAWCDTCNQFRPAFDAIALSRPASRFIWLDIEDDAEACGEVDVDNFPTLLIARDGSVLHFGVSLPHQAAVARLIDAMVTRQTAVNEVSDAVRALAVRLTRDVHRDAR